MDAGQMMNGSVEQNGNNNNIANGDDAGSTYDGDDIFNGGNGENEDNTDNIGDGCDTGNNAHVGNDGNDGNDGNYSNAESRYGGSNSSNGEKISPGLGDLLTMGAASGISVGGGLILGIILDNHFHTDPYFTFSGLGLGIVLAGGVIFSEVKKYL